MNTQNTHEAHILKLITACDAPPKAVHKLRIMSKRQVRIEESEKQTNTVSRAREESVAQNKWNKVQ